MVPFVERNYNLVELGPRGTGKSHLFQQISPYAHLISGGKATVAKMFVNNATGQRGLVCQYDVVCFDEVSGISFDQKDGVNIMKGYMASGQFSRGKENIRADGSIVMVGNFDVDVEQQQRIGHLLSPLPPEMRNDTAFMDRIHAYRAGLGLSEAEARRAPDRSLRAGERFPERVLEQAAVRQPRLRHAGARSPRRRAQRPRHRSGEQDRQRPDEAAVPRPGDAGPRRGFGVDRAVGAGIPPAREGAAEARASRANSATPTSATRLARRASSSSSRRRNCTATKRSRAIRCRPARCGPSAWERGGSRRRALPDRGDVRTRRRREDPEPAARRRRSARASRSASRISIRRAKELVGDRNPREARVLDPDAGHGCRQDRAPGLACRSSSPCAGRCWARNTRGGTIVVGALNLGGSIEMIPNAVRIAELAIDKQAQTLLMPVAARRQLNDLPDDLWTKIKHRVLQGRGRRRFQGVGGVGPSPVQQSFWRRRGPERERLS